MTTITKPSAPNAFQWIVVEKWNGRLAVRGNAFKEFMREVAKELLRLSGEEGTGDA